MDKLFTVAGYSTLNGETKARFATSMDRVKVLARNGHTDIKLQELPKAMTKAEALAFLGGKAAPAAEVVTWTPHRIIVSTQVALTKVIALS